MTFCGLTGQLLEMSDDLVGNLLSQPLAGTVSQFLECQQAALLSGSRPARIQMILETPQREQLSNGIPYVRPLQTLLQLRRASFLASSNDRIRVAFDLPAVALAYRRGDW